MPHARYDAHRHISDDSDAGVNCVVNGTSPGDWAGVLAWTKERPQAIPAIGLHPWKVNDASDDWQAQFLDLIDRARAVGEIGLDRWVEGYDIGRQEAAFRWQLKQAAERNLPVSIHCLKAGDALLHCLKENALPRRGIHLHAYSGSAEQVPQFAELGAYFSFHTGQFKPNAKKVPAAVKMIPSDRLLIETDAPDTLDGQDVISFLRKGYETVAELRDGTVDALVKQVADNFERYFNG